VKRKELWLFLAKLIPLTLLFGYIWLSGLQAKYPDLLDPIALPFFKLVGVRRWWLALVMEHFTNIVPYAALVLATPGLIERWRRALLALFGGLAIIVLAHLLLSTAVYYLEIEYRMSKAFYRFIVPMYLLNDSLPLVLWLAFYPAMPERLLGWKFFSRSSRPRSAAE